MSEPERDEETISRSVRNRYGGLADGHDIGGCGENGHSAGVLVANHPPAGPKRVVVRRATQMLN